MHFRWIWCTTQSIKQRSLAFVRKVEPLESFRLSFGLSSVSLVSTNNILLKCNIHFLVKCDCVSVRLSVTSSAYFSFKTRKKLLCWKQNRVVLTYNFIFPTEAYTIVVTSTTTNEDTMLREDKKYEWLHTKCLNN